jgi:hypothetical protein
MACNIYKLSHLLSSSLLGMPVMAAGANTAPGAARSLNASDSRGAALLLLLLLAGAGGTTL